jgi:hypothetical protein
MKALYYYNIIKDDIWIQWKNFTITENQFNDNHTVTYNRIFDTAIQREGQLTSGPPAYDTAFRKHSSS